MEELQIQSQIHASSDLTEFERNFSVGAAPWFFDTDARYWMNFQVLEDAKEKAADELHESKLFYSAKRSRQDVFESDTCVERQFTYHSRNTRPWN